MPSTTVLFGSRLRQMAVHSGIQTNALIQAPDEVRGVFWPRWQPGPLNILEKFQGHPRFQCTPALLRLQLYSCFHPATVQAAGFVLSLLSPDLLRQTQPLIQFQTPEDCSWHAGQHQPSCFQGWCRLLLN